MACYRCGFPCLGRLCGVCADHRKPPPPETLVDALQDRIVPASGPLLSSTPIVVPTDSPRAPEASQATGGEASIVEGADSPPSRGDSLDLAALAAAGKILRSEIEQRMRPMLAGDSALAFQYARGLADAAKHCRCGDALMADALCGNCAAMDRMSAEDKAREQGLADAAEAITAWLDDFRIKPPEHEAVEWTRRLSQWVRNGAWREFLPKGRP